MSTASPANPSPTGTRRAAPSTVRRRAAGAWVGGGGAGVECALLCSEAPHAAAGPAPLMRPLHLPLPCRHAEDPPASGNYTSMVAHVNAASGQQECCDPDPTKDNKVPCELAGKQKRSATSASVTVAVVEAAGCSKNIGSCLSLR